MPRLRPAACLIALTAVGGLSTTAHADALDPDRIVKVAPANGAAAVAGTRPSWCAGIETTAKPGAVARVVEGRDQWGWTGITPRLAEYLCAQPDEPSWQEQTGYLIQQWANMTLSTPEEAVESIRIRLNEDAFAAEAGKVCERIGEVSDEAAPLEKVENEMLRALFACGYGASPIWYESFSPRTDDLHWHLDRGAEIDSELVKTAYLLSCLNNGNALKDDATEEQRRFQVAGAAVCVMEAKTLDRELAIKSAEEYGAWAQAMVREATGRVEILRRQFEEVIDGLAEKDAAYRQILVDAPKAGWAAWEEAAQANEAAMTLASDYEDKFFGPSEKARQGCSDDLRAALEAHAKTKKIKAKEDIDANVRDLVGYTLASRLVACYGAEEDQTSGQVLSHLVAGSRAYRGPRTAAWFAALDALAEVRADRERFPLEPKHLGRRGPGPFHVGYAPNLTEGKGVVSKVRKASANGRDYVIASFKKERWQEPEYTCTKTSRITSITVAGVVNYEHRCKKTGKMVSKSSKERDVAIPAAAAAGIEPGRFVKFARNYMADVDGAREGFPIEVFGSKQMKKVVAAYGVAL